MSINERFDPARLWTVIETVRAQAPLVHSITNLVVMNVTANVLLAVGASPAMVYSPDEVEDFTPRAKALVVNIGTLDSVRLAAMKLAVAKANATKIPWILDPVGAGTTPYRLQAAKALSHCQPAVIRGNGSEILALAESSAGAGKGVDSVDGSETALDAARTLAIDRHAIVAVTGTVDYVTDGMQMVEIANGHPLMARVTGLGCSATAVIGACLAVETDTFTATVAGLARFDVAGEQAARTAKGPGSLQTDLLDMLYGLEQSVFQEITQIRVADLCHSS